MLRINSGNYIYFVKKHREMYVIEVLDEEISMSENESNFYTWKKILGQFKYSNYVD